MAGNQAVVEFLLKWSESGGNLPDKVKRDLDRMGQSSTQATSLTDKLGQAFTRLERREPTNAIRQLKGAVDGLALSTLGAAGPMGRLGVAFAGLGVGGPIGIVAIGGLAAIAAGLKAIIDQANGLDEALKKINDEFANMVGGRAAQFAKLGALRARAEELQRPGVIESALTPPPGQIGLPLAGIVTSNLRTARLAELRTVQAEIVEMEQQTQDSRTQLEQRGENDRKRIRDAARRQQADDDKKAIQEEAQRWENHLRSLQNSAARVALSTTRFAPSPITLRGPSPGNFQFAQVEGFEDVKWVRFQHMLSESLDESGKAALRAARAHQIASVQIVNAAFGILQSLASGGGFGGILSGIGGIVGLGNPLLGAVIGGVGGLISSAESNVRVASLSPTAQDQLSKSLNRTPDRVNIVVVDSTGRRIDEFIYEAGRRTRRDAVQRLPTGG